MKKILLISLIVALFACGKKQIKLIQLKPVKVSKQCDISIPNFLQVFDDKAYIAGDAQGIVYKYNANTLKFEKNIGSKGKSEKEFLNPFDMLQLPSGKLLLNDIFNFRFAFINSNGEIEKTKKYNVPYLMATDKKNKKAYFQNSPFFNNHGIFEFNEKNFNHKKVADLDLLKKQNADLKTTFYLFDVLDENLILSFPTSKKLFTQNKQGEVKPLNFSFLPKLQYKKYIFGRPRFYKDDLYITYADYTSPAENFGYDTEVELNDVKANFYILKSDLNGNVKKVYNLITDGVLSNDSWDMHNNSFIMYDYKNEKLVLYKM